MRVCVDFSTAIKVRHLLLFFFSFQSRGNRPPHTLISCLHLVNFDRGFIRSQRPSFSFHLIESGGFRGGGIVDNVTGDFSG